MGSSNGCFDGDDTGVVIGCDGDDTGVLSCDGDDTSVPGRDGDDTTSCSMLMSRGVFRRSCVCVEVCWVGPALGLGGDIAVQGLMNRLFRKVIRPEPSNFTLY